MFRLLPQSKAKTRANTTGSREHVWTTFQNNLCFQSIFVLFIALDLDDDKSSANIFWKKCINEGNTGAKGSMLVAYWLWIIKR